MKQVYTNVSCIVTLSLKRLSLILNTVNTRQLLPGGLTFKTRNGFFIFFLLIFDSVFFPCFYVTFIEIHKKYMKFLSMRPSQTICLLINLYKIYLNLK